VYDILLNLIINKNVTDETVQLNIFQKIFFTLIKVNNINLIKKFLDEEKLSLNLKLTPIYIIISEILSNPYNKEFYELLQLILIHPKIFLEKSNKEKMLKHAELENQKEYIQILNSIQVQ
jgi:hypothetical protein